MNKIASILMLIGLSGCMATAPITHQPMTARPAPSSATMEAPQARQPGSLYSEAKYRPLLSDKKASRVGDVLTVTITERTQANTQSKTALDKSGSVTASIPTLGKVPLAGLAGLSVEASGQNTFAGSGSSEIDNLFSGSITVTVIDVYPNGNLLVSGEKQLAINKGHEFVRFSGVVQPDFISGNQVPSSRVADARLEYRQDGALDSAQTMGWLSRFFLSVLPF